MITRSRTLQLAAANDGSSLPQPDNEKSKRKAAGRKRDDQSSKSKRRKQIVFMGPNKEKKVGLRSRVLSDDNFHQVHKRMKM